MDGCNSNKIIKQKFCVNKNSNLKQLNLSEFSRIGILIVSGELMAEIVSELMKYKCNLVFINPYFKNNEMTQVTESCDYIFSDNENIFKDEKFILKYDDLLILKLVKKSLNSSKTTDSFIFFTSGSTGRPKEVYRKREVCLAESEGLIQKLNLTSDDRVLLLAPCYHVYGQSLSLAAKLVNAKIKYMNTMCLFSRILKEFEKEAYTVFVGTPFYYNKMYADLKNITSVRLFLNAGGYVSKEVIKCGLLVKNQYGSTETGAISVSNKPCSNYNDIGNVGTPLPGVKIVGKQNFIANQMSYCRFCVNTAYLAYKIIEDGREINLYNPYLTNDYGWIEENGLIHLEGRIDELANYYGEKYSLKEVERILVKHPKVKEVYVKKEVNSETEYCIALVVVREGENLIQNELIEFCSDSLCSFKFPKKIVFVDHINKNNLGKMRKEV